MLCVLADELGANEVAGLKQSFGKKVKHFCRSCMFEQPAESNRSEETLKLPAKPVVDIAVLPRLAAPEWNILRHWSPVELRLAYRHWRSRTSVMRQDQLQLQIDSASKAERAQLSRDTGVSEESIFDSALQFDVTVQLPHDILHVVFEGALLCHLKFLLGRLRSELGAAVVDARVAWISTVSGKIGCFGRVNPYFVGQLDKFCDPAQNGKCGLRGMYVKSSWLYIVPDMVIECYCSLCIIVLICESTCVAVDIATIAFLLPAALGDLLSRREFASAAAFFGAHLSIVNSLLKFTWSEKDVVELARDIDRFHDDYLHQLGESWWRPKLHSYLHIPVDILRYISFHSLYTSIIISCHCDLCLYVHAGLDRRATFQRSRRNRFIT